MWAGAGKRPAWVARFVFNSPRESWRNGLNEQGAHYDFYRLLFQQRSYRVRKRFEPDSGGWEKRRTAAFGHQCAQVHKSGLQRERVIHQVPRRAAD